MCTSVALDADNRKLSEEHWGEQLDLLEKGTRKREESADDF